MDGLFNSIGGITMVICGVGGFCMILWIMSHAHHEHPGDHPDGGTHKNDHKKH